MLVGAMLLIGVLVLGAVLVWAFRRMTIDERNTEARLHEPGAHTLVYDIPTGQDPAVLVSALASAGFTAIGEMEGGFERLYVECPNPDDRAEIRSILEHMGPVHDGHETPVGHVSFEDER